jgi:hypothetical protein
VSYCWKTSAGIILPQGVVRGIRMQSEFKSLFTDGSIRQG